MLISKKCYNFLFIYSYQTYSINKDVFNQYGEEEGEEIGMVSWEYRRGDSGWHLKINTVF